MLENEFRDFINKNNIPYKENDKNFILLCPSCLLEQKERYKLYIDKQSFIFHCFRCEIKGPPQKLPDILKIYQKVGYQFPNEEYNRIALKLKIAYIKFDFKPHVKPSKKYLTFLRNLNFPFQTTRPNKFHLQYLNSRSIIKLPNSILFSNNIIIPPKIKIKNPIIFRSFFRTNYIIYSSKVKNRFKFFLSFYNSNHFEHIHKKLLNLGINIVKIPDFYTLFPNNRKYIKNVYVFEGIFDVLSMYQILNDNTRNLIIGSFGKSNFANVPLFLKLLLEMKYITNIQNIFFIYDNDVKKIPISTKRKIRERILDLDSDCYFFNTYSFIENFLNLNVKEYKFKDLNEFLCKKLNLTI